MGIDGVIPDMIPVVNPPCRADIPPGALFRVSGRMAASPKNLVPGRLLRASSGRQCGRVQPFRWTRASQCFHILSPESGEASDLHVPDLALVDPLPYGRFAALEVLGRILHGHERFHVVLSLWSGW